MRDKLALYPGMIDLRFRRRDPFSRQDRNRDMIHGIIGPVATCVKMALLKAPFGHRQVLTRFVFERTVFHRALRIQLHFLFERFQFLLYIHVRAAFKLRELVF